MPRTNIRRANGHRRSQLIAKVKRRDTHCWLPSCRQPVDTSLPPGLDPSPEVHELIPVSRGGDPLDLTNCVLTHRACNRWIGNRTPPEVLQAIQDAQAAPGPVAGALDW